MWFDVQQGTWQWAERGVLQSLSLGLWTWPAFPSTKQHPGLMMSPSSLQMADAMEMMILSILAPQLHCEWRLPSWQVALLTSVGSPAAPFCCIQFCSPGVSCGISPFSRCRRLSRKELSPDGNTVPSPPHIS